MNILFLAHRVPFPPNKGEKIRTFHQIKYLAEKEHTIFLFAPIETDEDINSAKQLTQQLCKEAHYAKLPGPLSHVKGLLTHKPLSVTNFYSDKLQQKLNIFLQKQKVDAIICTSSSMAEYVFNLDKSLIADTKLIMDFMDLDSDKWQQYTQLKSFPMSVVYRRESTLLSEYEKRIHHKFDASFFISENEVELFLKSDKDLGKLHVVANGLDTSAFKPAPSKPEEGPNILFTGVMDYLPNVDAVCWFAETVWPQIIEKYPEAKFYVAGMNPNAKVKALENQKGIFITGFVDDIHHYFDQAHIFVAPFRIARGVQNKVLQAFACGLPTIGTPMAAEGINCQDNVHMYISENETSMAEKIEWVLNNPDAASIVGNKAAELVKNEYSWESKLSKLDELLEA